VCASSQEAVTLLFTSLPLGVSQSSVRLLQRALPDEATSRRVNRMSALPRKPTSGHARPSRRSSAEGRRRPYFPVENAMQGTAIGSPPTRRADWRAVRWCRDRPAHNRCELQVLQAPNVAMHGGTSTLWANSVLHRTPASSPQFLETPLSHLNAASSDKG